MSEGQTNRKILTIVAAIVLLIALLLTGYLGAYYALLEDRVSFASPPAPGVPFDLLLRPVYRWKHPMVEGILEPAHQFDRWCRPDYWPS